MKRATRLLIIFGVMVLLGMAIVGCINGNGEKEMSDDKIVIGFPMTGLDDQHWVEYLLLVEQAAEALGVEIVVTDAGYSEEKQLADVESLIARGVDGISILPLSSEVATVMLEKMDEAGIPFIVENDYPGMDPGYYDHYIAFIGMSDEHAGYESTKMLIEAGGTHFCGLDGTPGLSFSEARSSGFRKAVEEYDSADLLDTQYTNWLLTTGQEIMEDWLIAYPEVNAVWAAGTDPLLGALAGIEAAGKDPREMFLGGIDSTDAAMDALKEGLFKVVAGGHWAQGAYSLIILHDYIHGFDTDAEKVDIDLAFFKPGDVDRYRETVQIPLHEGVSLFDWKNMSKVYNPDAKHRDMIVSPSPDNVLIH